MLRLKLANPPFYNPITDGTTYLQTLIIAKDIALRVNGFLENLPLADDLDFAMKIANCGQLGWVVEPVFLYRLGHHNQTAPSVAKAKTFLAAHAFVHTARAARVSGIAVPDPESFMSQFEPSDRERTEFKVRQSIRYINTVWVYGGLLAAMFAGTKVLFENPILFSKHLVARIVYWRK